MKTPFDFALWLAVAILVPISGWAQDPPVIDIGDRRELFLDDLLIGEFQGTERQLHSPQLLPARSRPYGHYATVLYDGENYRLYYRADKDPNAHWRNGWDLYHLGEVTRLAESRDGLTWERPNLGLYEMEEFPKGDVVLADEFLVTHNFTPFKDSRPGVPESERFKAVGGLTYPASNWGGWKAPDDYERLRKEHGPGGLFAYVSPDGLKWRRMQDEPIISESLGKFDSQNVAFWSEAEGQYVCYFRAIQDGHRSVRRSTSADFRTWSKPVDMQGREPGEHLYTSGTQPYFRAPHIYVAPATRFMSNRSSVTDVVLMSSRPGSHQFDRLFKEAWIRPGLGAKGWGNRQNYVTWNIVPLNDTHMTLYMYGGGQYQMRYDGFVSVHAGYEKGEFRTAPLQFSGRELEINYSTSAAGYLQVEIQDLDGTPLAGFRLEDCEPIYGDEIQREVQWTGDGSLEALAGQPVVLRFVMAEADLFSIKFNQ